jgi:caa(3)-type oxidase subunit IV
MSAESHAAAAHDAHAHPSYVKIWAILLGLLVVSVAGPFIGIRIVTLITAFGIAIVKAYMVARYFMHINIEKKYVAYLVGTMVILMLLMVGAVAPDVMHHDGANWHNQAAADWVKKGMAQGESGAGHHGEHGGGEHEGAEAPKHE